MFVTNGVTFVTVVIRMHVCAERRAYTVRWDGKPKDVTGRVIAFLDARSKTHAWDVIDMPAVLKELDAWLNPECEHGMSMSNCYGPQHYYMDDEERAYYGV